MDIENGVYEIENDTYHASSAVSRSALMQFKKSPYHYWYKYLSGKAIEEEQTPAMVFGNLVHTVALEPNEIPNRFVIAPNLDKRTKFGKEAWAGFMMAVEAQNLTIIKEEDLIRAKGMAESIKKSDLIQNLLEEASFESSIYFTHPTSGIQCKVRPDIWAGEIIADLKSTNDGSYRAFQGSAYKYGYYLQAGMISEALLSIGIEMKKFINLAVEKEPPYASGIYILDEEAVEYGVRLFDELMEKMARCMASNYWPGYGIQNLCVPNYAKFDELLETE